MLRGFGDHPVEARASGYRNSNTALASSAGTHFRGKRFYGETQNPLFFVFNLWSLDASSAVLLLVARQSSLFILMSFSYNDERFRPGDGPTSAYERFGPWFDRPAAYQPASHTSPSFPQTYTNAGPSMHPFREVPNNAQQWSTAQQRPAMASYQPQSPDPAPASAACPGPNFTKKSKGKIMNQRLTTKVESPAAKSPMVTRNVGRRRIINKPLVRLLPNPRPETERKEKEADVDESAAGLEQENEGRVEQRSFPYMIYCFSKKYREHSFLSRAQNSETIHVFLACAPMYFCLA